MSKVNYNEISQVYDDVRQVDIELINSFLQEIEIEKETRVLDIGCGTGNYTDSLQKITQGEVYGVEPSKGMLGKAKAKQSKVVFKQGSAAELPFEDEFFDFVYMTDVIHHVPEIGAMFAEINRVLKEKGRVCIVTQSHQQIENRPIARFFPGTVAVDKRRYPDIPEVIANAEDQGLKLVKNAVLNENAKIELGQEFLELVKKKGYSMLHLLSEEEYREGLMGLKNKLMNGKIIAGSAGETLVWLTK
jgi:ubiquinone/menaquinone biosynthesis C-methylase UbiE